MNKDKLEDIIYYQNELGKLEVEENYIYNILAKAKRLQKRLNEVEADIKIYTRFVEEAKEDLIKENKENNYE